MTASGSGLPSRPSKLELRLARRGEECAERRTALRQKFREIACWLTPPFGHEGLYVEVVRGLVYETTCVGCGKTVSGFASWGSGRGGMSSRRPTLTDVRALVDEQAEDDALWAIYPIGKQPISEAYLQQELRRLHALIERATDAE